jgi:hypothetical protein
MQKTIDEMKRTAENHRALNEPVPVPLLFAAVELPQWQYVVMPMAVI